jgi:hypothetical protein
MSARAAALLLVLAGILGFALIVLFSPKPARAQELVPAYSITVRLTYYFESGVTYGCTEGSWWFICGTRPGGTACSWNFPIGTHLAFPHGEVFVCNDRGRLGSRGWVDVWRRPDLQRMYGQYVTLEVLL